MHVTQNPELNTCPLARLHTTMMPCVFKSPSIQFAKSEKSKNSGDDKNDVNLKKLSKRKTGTVLCLPRHQRYLPFRILEGLGRNRS